MQLHHPNPQIIPDCTIRVFWHKVYLLLEYLNNKSKACMFLQIIISNVSINGKTNMSKWCVRQHTMINSDNCTLIMWLRKVYIGTQKCQMKIQNKKESTHPWFIQAQCNNQKVIFWIEAIIISPMLLSKVVIFAIYCSVPY